MKSALRRLVLEDRRPAALIVESKDWDELIVPALTELGACGILPSDAGSANVVRCLCESIYYRGYLRGQTELLRPQLVVGQSSPLVR